MSLLYDTVQPYATPTSPLPKVWGQGPFKQDILLFLSRSINPKYILVFNFIEREKDILQGYRGLRGYPAKNVEIMPSHFVRVRGLRGYPAKKIEMLFPFLSKYINITK